MTGNPYLDAYQIAVDITPIQEDSHKQLEAIFKMASALSGALTDGDFSVCIDCLGDIFQKGQDVFPIPDEGVAGRSMDTLPVHGGNHAGCAPDKALSGHGFVTHKASSSAQGGEKPERGATLSGSETVATRCSCDLCRRVHGSRENEGMR